MTKESNLRQNLATAEQPVVLRCGIDIQVDQQWQLQALIDELHQRAPAQFILLTDVTGQVLYTTGAFSRENLTPLAALVAGDLAAGQQIAQLMGNYQPYQITLRVGEGNHTFIAEAGAYLVTLVQVNGDVPLGWARMLIQQTTRRLAQVLADVSFSDAETGATIAPEGEDLAGLFDQALDTLWLE